jgi:hypothetical protein
MVGYVWAAIDVDTRELLMGFMAENILNAEAFLSVGDMHKQASYPRRQDGILKP